MVVDTVYKTNRGNQDKTVGIIIKGATARIQIFGSQSVPESLADLEDCTDGVIMDQGMWSFEMLPEYIYFTGTIADPNSIQIIGMTVTDQEKTLT